MMSDTANDGDPAPNGFLDRPVLRRRNARRPARRDRATRGRVRADVPIGIYGIAGGGVAAGFAAEKQASYAPELDVVGTVLQAMVIDSATFERKADGGIGAGFVFANSLGYAPATPRSTSTRS